MKSLVPVALAVLLSACAQTPPAPRTTPSAVRPAALQNFRAEGKLAWSQAGKGDSARFAWNYTAPRLHVDLLSPLGSTAATLDAEPGRAVLETAKGDRFVDASLEALSVRLFDMYLPLTGIEYWIQGQPIPGQPFTESALPEGKRLQQRGYTLDYPVWVEVQGRALPSQIDISNGELSLKLRIREWTLP